MADEVFDEKNLERANKTYESLCKALDDDNWKYDKDEENLSISLTAQGDDLPISVRVSIDVKRQLIVLLSEFPFKIAEDKRYDAAVAITVVNNRLINGSFDYDITDGTIFFRMTNCFEDCEVGLPVFTYMLMCACRSVDDYNDKFLMISKGILTLEQFISQE